MKLLLTVFFSMLMLVVSGQVIKPVPSEEEWHTYFYANKRTIENKLYHLAIEGKIKAYQTDSLAAVYASGDLKRRGTKEIMRSYSVGSGFVDSVQYVPFSTDEFEDLWFSKTIASSPFDATESNRLMAMGSSFSLEFSGMRTPPMPFCWYAIAEIKNNLDKHEFEWLQLMYYYSSNDNNILFRETSYDDCYWDINHIKPAKVWYHCDSLIYNKLGNSLHASSFYIEEFLNDTKDSTASGPIIYDHQTRKNISYHAFQEKYREELIVFIATNPDDPAAGKDSVILEPFRLNNIKSLTIDNNSHALKTFNFELKGSGKSDKVIRFSIDAEYLRKRNSIPAIFWFYEDYFNWKK